MRLNGYTGTIAGVEIETVTAQANNDLYMKINAMEVFNQAQPFTAGSPFIVME